MRQSRIIPTLRGRDTGSLQTKPDGYLEEGEKTKGNNKEEYTK